mgnify:FL=1
MTNIEMLAKIEFDVFSGGGAFSDDRVADLVWDALELVLRHESLDVYGSDAELWARMESAFAEKWLPAHKENF